MLFCATRLKGETLLTPKLEVVFCQCISIMKKVSLFKCFCDVEPVEAAAAAALVCEGKAQGAVDGRQVIVHTVQVSFCT